MHEFSYKPSFSYAILVLIGFGIALLYFGITGSYDIAYRRLVILPAPYSKYVMLTMGIILSIMGFKQLVSWLSTIGKNGKLVLGNNQIKFPVYSLFSAKEMQLTYSDITQLYVNNEDEEEFSVVIHSRNSDRFEFDSTYFKNEKEYIDFVNQIEKNYRT